MVITADDLGAQADVNAAVVNSVREGRATHASLIVNLAGFEEACALAHASAIHDRVGLHLNLTEGAPIGAAMRECARFCTGGVLKLPSRFAALAPLSRSEARAAADEIRLQIVRAREHGFPLTHLDSHQHVHVEPSMAAVVLAVAREMGVARVRPATNCGSGWGPLRRMRHAAYNRRLTASGLRGVEDFGRIDEVVWQLTRGGGHWLRSLEVMIHPQVRPDGTVIDGTTGDPLAQKLAELHGTCRDAGC